MKNYDFDYEIKHFSNKSSEISNPQTRSLSIIVAFNALFQATDYHFVKLNKIKNDSDLLKSVNEYAVLMTISIKNMVFFPIYLADDGLISVKKNVIDNVAVAGFCFYLKKDLRERYGVVKITESVKDLVFKDTVEDIKRYNNFLHDDVWVIVVAKPHGRNFIVYGREFIEDKLSEINDILKKESSETGVES